MANDMNVDLLSEHNTCGHFLNRTLVALSLCTPPPAMTMQLGMHGQHCADTDANLHGSDSLREDGGFLTNFLWSLPARYGPSRFLGRRHTVVRCAPAAGVSCMSHAPSDDNNKKA
jgi:hypothetical protein